MRRLEGKTILVAGAGGIGTALAQRYAQEGANVVLGDLDEAAAGAAVEDIRQSGGRAIAVHLDGGDEASIDAAVAQTKARFGGLDGLNANFASFVDGAPDVGVTDLKLEIFDETMRVNLRGFLLCARSALPAMIERGGGSIVFTSSAAAYCGEDTRVAYAISKAGGHALMRHIAVRYGPQGIRANSIAPGTIFHGNMDEILGEAFKQQLRSSAKIKSRFGQPADIAGLSALLMSDEGSYITGQVISVDGGVTLRP
jgi:NAD(P)-dependent dehydrogenase (short-subunit alcohol dehydrogenase family)